MVIIGELIYLKIGDRVISGRYIKSVKLTIVASWWNQWIKRTPRG